MEESDIQLNTSTGVITVRGFKHYELAVHPRIGDSRQWTITHLPTGCSFGYAFDSPTVARAAMEAIFRLRNSWDVPAKIIEKMGPQILAEIERFGGRKVSFVPRSLLPPRTLNGF